jgi:two-component system, OmpR family, response regulator RegX3
VRVAILEDDAEQAKLVNTLLSQAGFSCTVFESGRTCIQNIKRDSFDVLILDWLVSDLSGLEVLRWARQHLDWQIPVLFLTAMEHEEDVVRALQDGADDYLVKPARPRELVARVTALARRVANPESAQEVMSFPPFTIDRAQRQVCREGQVVELTQKEYELVLFLFRNNGRVLSRGHILESVWGRSPSINTRTVDTHVSRLRSKLNLEPTSGWRLASIYQHGYRLERVEGSSGEGPVAASATN